MQVPIDDVVRAMAGPPVWEGRFRIQIEEPQCRQPDAGWRNERQQEPRSAETSWLPRSGEHRARGHTSCKHLERSTRESLHLPNWLPDLRKLGQRDGSAAQRRPPSAKSGSPPGTAR
jgi:hypothetical protein